MASKTISIPRETVMRLLKDVRNIVKNPLTDNGIYYLHDDVDMMKGYAMIVGPEDTPYYGGYYFFEIKYPSDYPHTPPSITFMTNGEKIRFNPNLYVGGKVCISLLNTWRGDQWTSCQTISTVLLTLCTLLCKDPLLNEPGIGKKHKDFSNYTQIIEYKNIEIALLNMIQKKTGIFIKKFSIFTDEMTNNFHKNKLNILKFITEKTIKHPKHFVASTTVYAMHVIIDYQSLLQLFTEYCEDNKIEDISTNDNSSTNEVLCSGK